MKARIAILIAVAAGCLAVASCGGGGRDASMTYSAPSSPPPMTIALDTAGVLAVVQLETSDSSPPFQVDDAAVTVTPLGDETSAPVGVDAT